MKKIEGVLTEIKGGSNQPDRITILSRKEPDIIPGEEVVIILKSDFENLIAPINPGWKKI